MFNTDKKKEYTKPTITEEKIELNDVIASSSGHNDYWDDSSFPSSDDWWGH